MQLVSICVCTFRRPQLLRLLLRSLAHQSAGTFEIEVVVVDNDAAGGAQSVVDEFSGSGDWTRCVYAIEPRAGISYARNRAVSLSRGERIAFIDDDELAADGWLWALLAEMDRSGADVVLGPVLSTYPPGSVRWAATSGCFDRPRHATGTIVSSDEGRTGNALVRSRWLNDTPPFDPRYALTGGEDYAFFKRIVGAGAVLTWCDEAVVSELVPMQRQRLRWVLARALRGSMTYWRINGMRDSTVRKAWRAAYGIVGALTFTLAGVAALPFGLHRAVPHWSKAAKGLGRLAALSTHNLDAYHHG